MLQPYDNEYTIKILKELLTTPSVTGDTSDALTIVQQEFIKFGLDTHYTNKGGLIGTINAKNKDNHRAISAHIDTLGAMVKEIKSNGRIKLTKIGGYMWNSIEGEYCTITTGDNKCYTGTILTTKASTHVYGSAEAAKLERNEDTMEVRLDEKVSNTEEVRALGIEVGDFVSFDTRTEVTKNGYVKSRHLDDKVSVAILLGVVKYISDNNIVLPITTHFFITNYEEVGHGAAVGVPTGTTELLAVDMGCVGDGLTGDEYSVSICAKDSSGPYNYSFRQRLKLLCQEESIDYNIDIFPHYGSDASAALRAGLDVKHALIGPGVDASHAYERTHIEGILNTARLILAYLQTK